MMQIQGSKPDTVQGTGKKKYAAQVADRLLTLICEQAKEDGGRESEEFCHRIRSYQLAMYESGMLEESVAQKCIGDCEAYLGRLHKLTRAWSGEFRELIDSLKESLAQRAEDHSAFHNRLFESSDNIHKVASLDDIREMRELLVKLVRDLRQTVTDQQQQEERRNADFDKRVQELEAKLEIARREAVTDPLTGIPNRAAFDRTLKSWIEQKKSFVVGMVDLDHFKSINDTHGHRVGDSALRCAAEWIRGNTHAGNFLGRIGGDEFGILLDRVSLTEAGARFSKLLSEFSKRSYTCTNGETDCTVSFTMSCGLAEFDATDTAVTVVQRADEALRDAKKQRNRACTKRRPFLSAVFRRNA